MNHLAVCTGALVMAVASLVGNAMVWRMNIRTRKLLHATGEKVRRTNALLHEAVSLMGESDEREPYE